MIAVFLVIVAAVVVVAIALVAIGRETFTLGQQPKQAHFDLDEAVEYVADRLPDEVTARLGYDDVGIEGAHDPSDVVARAFERAEAPDTPVGVERREDDFPSRQMPMRCASSSRWYVGSPR